MNNQWIRRINRMEGFMAVMLLVLGIGCGLSADARQDAGALKAEETPRGAAQEVVMAGKPTRKTLTLVTTQPARMEAIEHTPMHSKLAAYVGQVLVDYGDKVTKGQPLLKLSAPEVNAESAQKQALVAQSQAELRQAEAGMKAAEAAIATAASRVVQAEAGTERANADVVRWRAEYARHEQLAANGSINRQVADETKQKLGAAEASLRETTAAIDGAKALLAQAKAEVAKSISDVEAARSRIGVAEANLAQAKAMESYLTISAPFDGVITERSVDPGHFVQPTGANVKPLFVVARTDKMRIFIAVPEIEAGYVDLEDVVTVEVQSLRGAEFKGKVTRTGFALDPDNRSMNTIVDLDNPEGRLRPGLYAMAKISLQEQKDVLTLPAAAVVRQNKEAFCNRLLNGKAVKTPIQLGIKVGDDFEVTSGLKEDELVILNKASSLKDGQQVEVLPAEAKK